MLPPERGEVGQHRVPQQLRHGCMTALVVATEAPQQPEVLDLLRQSDAFSASLYPVEAAARSGPRL